MNNNQTHYTESGITSPAGSLIFYVTTLITTALLSYVYIAITQIMPLVYINFLLVIGYGIVLMYIIKILNRLTYIRSKRNRVVRVIFVVLMANLFQWCAYIMFAYMGKMPDLGIYFANLHRLILPHNLFPAIAEINTVGMWEMFGIVFNGPALAIIWIAESLIIAGIPVLATLKHKPVPFSEQTNKWYPLYVIKNDFRSIAAPTKFEKELSANALQALKELDKGDALRHAKVHLFYDDAESYSYISVENITTEERGKGKTVHSPVITNLRIEKASAQAILEEFHHKHEKNLVL